MPFFKRNPPLREDDVTEYRYRRVTKKVFQVYIQSYSTWLISNLFAKLIRIGKSFFYRSIEFPWIIRKTMIDDEIGKIKMEDRILSG